MRRRARQNRRLRHHIPVCGGNAALLLQSLSSAWWLWPGQTKAAVGTSRQTRRARPELARRHCAAMRETDKMTVARMKHFGWGREGEGLTAGEEAFLIARAERRFGTALDESASPPRLDEIALDPPRMLPPASLGCCTTEHYDRVAH